MTEAAPGDTVVLAGGPQTRAFDTRVEVGGLPAEVVAVERSSECSACETCRVEAECLTCGYCAGEGLADARRIECFGDPFEATEGLCGACVESVSFIVPALPPGPTTVMVLNANGASEPYPLVVTAAEPLPPTADTGVSTGDTATPSTPTGDTGTPATTTGDTQAASTGATADTAMTADTATPSLTVDTTDTAATADTGLPTADTGLPLDTTDTGLPVDTTDTGLPLDTADTALPPDTGPTGDTGL